MAVVYLRSDTLTGSVHHSAGRNWPIQCLDLDAAPTSTNGQRSSAAPSGIVDGERDDQNTGVDAALGRVVAVRAEMEFVRSVREFRRVDSQGGGREAIATTRIMWLGFSGTAWSRVERDGVPGHLGVAGGATVVVIQPYVWRQTPERGPSGILLRRAASQYAGPVYQPLPRRYG